MPDTFAPLNELPPRSVASPPELSGGEIHLWTIDLSEAGNLGALGTDLLSADERERAARFRFDLHRGRFTRGRVALRRLLGAYAGENPSRLRFTYGARGKPALEAAVGSPTDRSAPIQFNISHSEDRALVVVVQDDQVGVDIEQIRPIPRLEMIASRFFSPNECEVILRADPVARSLAFLRYWTCKEALLKATGSGLSRPLNSFTIVFDPTGEPRVVGLDESPSTWSMFAFALSDGYLGAIAVGGKPRVLKGWTYEPG